MTIAQIADVYRNFDLELIFVIVLISLGLHEWCMACVFFFRFALSLLILANIPHAICIQLWMSGQYKNWRDEWKNSYNTTNYTNKEKWINGQIWNGKNWKIALTRIKWFFLNKKSWAETEQAIGVKYTGCHTIIMKNDMHNN